MLTSYRARPGLRAAVIGYLLLASIAVSGMAEERSHEPENSPAQSSQTGAERDINGNEEYEKKRLHRTINLASRQQMMGQRKLAGYCLGGQEDQTVSSRMLEQSSRVFSSQADRLAGKPAAGAPDVGEKLVAIKTIWEAILNAAQSDLDAPTATTLVELSDQLVTDTDQLLSMLVGQLDDADPFGRLVAESGRQRMLGQRTAALALCKRKGVTASLVEGKIGTIMADLEQNNRNLHAEDAVGKRVQRELDAAHTKLRHMKDLIASDQWTTHEMLETSDLFIDSMNRATSKLAEAGLRSI